MSDLLKISQEAISAAQDLRDRFGIHYIESGGSTMTVEEFIKYCKEKDLLDRKLMCKKISLDGEFEEYEEVTKKHIYLNNVDWTVEL